MVALTAVLVTLLLVSSTVTSPVPSQTFSVGDRLPFPPFDPRGLLCHLPIIKKALCPRQAPSGLSVKTPIGIALGTTLSSGAARFSVKYGSAQRWQLSSVASDWELPNGSSDVTALPLACPQDNTNSSNYSEDCLSMLLYVPTSVLTSTNVPTLMWIHGGSFIVGSATNPGLDGSNLAKATNSIVAVVQYRLGALGFNSPDGRTNFALQDITTALKFLQKVVPSFGGSASKITVAGQSSGANMIRALLAVPSASSLFQSAILQSDPMDYGFLSPGAQQTLQNYFNSNIKCNATDAACLEAMSIDDILSAQDLLFANGFEQDPSATQSEPMRPVHDGYFLTSTLDSTSPFPSVSKPILLSNVKNEAGLTIYSSFPDPMGRSLYDAVVNGTFGNPRTSIILSAPQYSIPVLADGEDPDARVQLETLGTDSVWKCATWTFARNWVGHGGKAYVGVYALGASYPGNDGVPFCTQNGSVCHQDDIEIVFGTVQSPTSAQSALISEMQARYSAFLHTGNPNPSGSSLTTWSPATTSNISALLFGGEGAASEGACDPRFWGSQVPYDYQVFGI
ncbi:Carboxylesterase [Heterobasidion irregulare TC 32-1]|uniref:Carboxylic ester hydrolase n=1 Tax=Heterobasidion irregulare (strain TC 32-1) TaxID=747525 RepID=W4KJY2_HETIT|nr:Carboxylesterase [Heterobasidion irregulare TC 32-1]ETW86173.1 Carboxylesterase [Heterobasidion irregulare TC 32-1]